MSQLEVRATAGSQVGLEGRGRRERKTHSSLKTNQSIDCLQGSTESQEGQVSREEDPSEVGDEDEEETNPMSPA